MISATVALISVHSAPRVARSDPESGGFNDAARRLQPLSGDKLRHTLYTVCLAIVCGECPGTSCLCGPERCHSEPMRALWIWGVYPCRSRFSIRFSIATSSAGPVETL
jgi:hypothetical protein